MAERRALPYGSWPSPITIDMAVASQIAFREPRISGGSVFWTEGRPAEQGRQVIVRWSDLDGINDVTPPPFNARTMAHEYGGGWYTVDSARKVVYFSNLPDGRIYRQPLDGEPAPLTVDGPYRYGDLRFDWTQDRVVCVREDHTGLDHAASSAHDGERIREPRNELVAVDITSGDVTVLATGADFYSSPCPSYNGLAWLQWNHPNMPWDSTELWVADIDDAGMQSNERKIAGGPDESIVQPMWSDGLVFVSDRSGWWNLYRWTPDGDTKPLAPMEAEFAGPQWVFGMSWYGTAEDGTIYAVANPGASGVWRVPRKGRAEWLELPDERIESLQVGQLYWQDEVTVLVYIGGSWSEPRSMVLVELTSDGKHVARRRVLRTQFELEVDTSYLARPEEIAFPTTDGGTAYAHYYPPTNPDVVGPTGEKPPLIVETHGGPTSASTTALQMTIDAFTSRGFAYVDVDYRGSSGHGREYMRELYGKWGIYDVDDAIAAARYLVDRGDVDAERLAIRGSSAGGYTTLAALAFHDVFAAGASHYGVGDLEALSRFTHKLESHYLDQLVAPYPEGRDLLRDRSPIYHVDKLSRPLIVLQGADDMVVPVAQAEQIVAALRRQKIPHAYLVFDGEGHGFRQAKNIKSALEAELSFYAQVFGFALADDFEPLKTEFLTA